MMIIQSSTLSKDKNGNLSIFREENIEIIIPQEILQKNQKNIRVKRLSDINDYFNQNFEIEVPDSIEVNIRFWRCVSEQIGSLATLGEEGDIVKNIFIEAN